MMMNGEKTIRINDSLMLSQSTHGLTFGTDAYLLAAYAEGGRKKNCADLGSGTGVIPLLCTHREKFNKIFAVEIQESFVSLIEKNIAQNSFGGKIIPIHADIRSLKASDIGIELDAVTANPPYMKVDSGKRNEHDEKFIARHEICGDINDFCACAYRLLKHGGRFYTVFRPDRLTDLVCSLRANKLEPKKMTFVHATPESEPCMVLVSSTKGASGGAMISRPLFLHSSREDAQKSILSDDAKKIYEHCSFEYFK